MLPQPVVVSGASGRLGSAMVASLAALNTPVLRWARPDYDLDDPAAASRLVRRDRPALVIHAAAWTDVDGCARQPQLALRRNATAVEELAVACIASGAALVLISTNEVFDGARSNGQGYAENDQPRPINAYGRSKLAGEEAASQLFSRAEATQRLWVLRTAWLFGPPGDDFPDKILAAADALEPGASLGVVSDEIGSPTYTADLATAIVRLLAAAPAGLYHLAGNGIASRFEVAAEVVSRCRPAIILKPISRHEFSRQSVAPAWAVLDSSRARSFGVKLRGWREALADYLATRCPPESAA